MDRLLERTRVIAATLALAGCGSITTAAPTDAAAEAAPEAAPETSPEASADLSPDVDTRTCAIKINEVQTGGAGGALDEFIEVYNTCPDRQFTLTGHSLVYRSDVGTTNVVLMMFGAQAIAANRPFFLCANASASYTGPAADAYYSASGLRDTGGGLALLGPDGQVLDSVGWGTATNAFVEGTATPAPAASQSIGRAPDGRDTDDNAADFSIRSAPTPGGAN